MILVDTSVWSLAFRHRRRGTEHPAARQLRQWILDDAPVVIPGIVAQELLSGVRDQATRARLLNLVRGFPMALATADDHLEAARIATSCRQAGVTSATVDCLIAAQAVTRDGDLLTTDSDFKRIARHCQLRVAVLTP